MFHVNPEFQGTMGELALIAIGTASFFHVVFAERAFGLGRSALIGEGEVGVIQVILVELTLFPLS